MDDTPHALLLDRTLEFFAAIEKLSLTYGVKGAVEIHHGTICPSASATHAIVGQFDPAAIGVIMDVGNMAVEGYEDYQLGIPVLGPYLTHVHLKNAAWRRGDPGQPWTWYWSPLDDGVVRVADFLAALEDSGYTGWVSQEDFSDRESSAQMIRRNRDFLRKLEQEQAHSLPSLERR
jgi:sugar phosphate isomerase/epimerase